MGRIIIIKCALVIPALLVNEEALAMLQKIWVQATFVHVLIIVLNDYVADDFGVFPEGFDTVSLLGVVTGNVLAIASTLAFLPVSDDVVFCDLCQFANAWTSALCPFSYVLLPVYELSLAESVHFLTVQKLANIVKFRSEQMPKDPFTVFEHSQKVLVFIPIVKSFSMEQVVFKISQIILIFWKYLKSKSVSSSMLKRAKIKVSLNVHSMRLGY